MKKRVKTDIPPNAKIAVIGHSGSGKSTLAVFLSEKYVLPLLHIDAIHFLPNWVEREPEEELALMRAFLDGNEERGWVIDGNYMKLEHERRMEEADLIIYLNFNRLVCYTRALRRSRKYRNKVRSSAAPGCEEKFDLAFQKWILRGGRTKPKLKRYAALVARYGGKSVELKNQREVERFKNELDQRT
ncbi:MAG: DNA topology modulation protein FlaR [Clostridia bacterium]|nr:DNA topology modulation protein FlaR [Clostridia bacterium]